MIRLRNVHRAYAANGKGATTPALAGIDLDVACGEFVCMVGPSGCGKSTLLDIIAGLQTPDVGEVTVARGLGARPVLMLQEAALFPWLTVLGNVEFGLRVRGLPKAACRDAAMAQLAAVRLLRFAQAFPHQLSGGMKQRAALARALALDPPVLLMDEPFAALDAQTRDLMHEELQRIWSDTRKTIVFVTHNVREAACLGDRVMLLSARPGRIVDTIAVDLLRPRTVTDAAVANLAHIALDHLRDEIEKVEREEFDDGRLHAQGGVPGAAPADVAGPR
jgi:NitT/TauT family transport system ATP-binding protein